MELATRYGWLTETVVIADGRQIAIYLDDVASGDREVRCAIQRGSDYEVTTLATAGLWDSTASEHPIRPVHHTGDPIGRSKT